MGLFNFIYKLTIIFSNKKKLKVFIALALVIMLVFVWSKGVFASTPTDDIAIQNYQLLLQENFISYLRSIYQYRPSNWNQSNFNQLVSRLILHQVYISVPTGRG